MSMFARLDRQARAVSEELEQLYGSSRETRIAYWTFRGGERSVEIQLIDRSKGLAPLTPETHTHFVRDLHGRQITLPDSVSAEGARTLIADIVRNHAASVEEELQAVTWNGAYEAFWSDLYAHGN